MGRPYFTRIIYITLGMAVLIFNFQNCGRLGNSGAPLTQNSSATAAVSSLSPSGSTIPSLTQIVDSQLNVWTVASGVIYVNGAAASYSNNVTLLLYYNGVIYQENSSQDWWYWDGTGWTAQASDPRD